MSEEQKIPSSGSDRTLDQLRLKALEQLDSLIPAPTKKSTYSYAELYEKRDEIQKFLIPELLPAEAVCVFMGEDGIGKTQLCSQLCAHVALRRESIFGMKLNVKHGRALVVATEDSKQKFTSAITKIMVNLEPSHKPKEVHIDFTEGSDFDDFLTLKDELETLLRANFYDLIILDTLSDLFTLIDGEINSNSHARKLLSFFQYLCNSFATTIIIIHHAAKSKVVANRKEGKLFVQKTDAQGAGAITQKPRTVLALTNDPKTTTQDGQYYINYLHVVKANLMGKHYMQNAIKLQFDTKTLLHKHQGTINIELMQEELIEQASGGTAPVNKKATPADIPIDQHKEVVEFIFKDEAILARADLIKKLCSQYGVGTNKVEQQGGYISHLLSQGLIEKYQFGSYKKGSGTAVQPDIGFVASVDPDEEAPF